MKSITLISLISMFAATIADAAFNVAGGATLTVNGAATTSNIQTADGSTLDGTGALNATTTVNGTLAPGGEQIGILSTGDLTFGATGVLDLQLAAAGVAGTDYDQVQVTGSVSIQAGATLQLSGAGGLSFGESVTILSNDGADAISGRFNGLAEGALLVLPTSGLFANISYVGGDGNDIVLSVRDTDGDGLDNSLELAGKGANGYLTGAGPTDPASNDTDGDGTLDGAEPSIILPVASYVYNVAPQGAPYNDATSVELNDGDVGGLVWPNAVDLPPLVAWTNANPDITFTFPSSQEVDSITVWVADGSSGFSPPSHFTIYADGVLQGTHAVTDPVQIGSVIPITLSGLGIDAMSVRIVATRTQAWSALAEVQFSAKAPIQTNGSIGTIAKSDLSLSDDDRVMLRVDSTATAGVTYDSIQVTGAVDLGTSTLQLFGTAGGVRNFDEIVLIDNDGVDPVVGRFGGTLAEGAAVTLPGGGDPLYLSYVGGDGNDVTLRYFDPDNDSLANDVDLDDDGDGISDLNELAGNDATGVSTGFGATNPLDNDTDRDGIDDLKEMLGQAASGVVSSYGATNPNLADTDSDGVSDSNELAGNSASGASSGFGSTNPNNAHSDTDGIPDGYELDGKNAAGVLSGFGATNPNSDDSDSDAISDFNELAGNDASGTSTGFGATNPLLADSDSDGISDVNELAGNNAEGSSTTFGATDPTKEDSDGDGFTDVVEIDLGYDPNNGGVDPLDGGLVVSLAADENDGDYSAGDLSLREAIERMKAAGTNGLEHTITFDPSLDGVTITLASDLDVGTVRPTLDLTHLPAGLVLAGSQMLGSNEFTIQNGELTLLNSVNNSPLTVDASASLKIGSGGVLGMVAGTLHNNGVVTLDRSDDVIVPALSGTGALTKKGNTLLTIAAANTMSGVLTVEEGTLRVNSSLGGNVLCDTSVAFHGGSIQYAGVLSGSCNVAVNSGSVRFLNNQTYTGSTTVTNATFEPSATMATSGITMSSAQLNYRSVNSLVNYPISGSGTLDNYSSLEFSSANTFSGTVNVRNLLTVTNTSGSATGSANLTLHGGGVLRGSGTIAGNVNTNFSFGDFVYPGVGSSQGTLTVNGSVTFFGSFSCSINGAQNDRIDVGGSFSPYSDLSLNLTGQGATEPVYIIAKYGSLVASPFSSITGMPAGYSIDYAYFDGTSSNNIAIKRNLTAAETWAVAQGLTVGAEGNGLLSVDANGDGKNNAYHFAFDTDPLGNTVNERKLRSSITTVGGVTSHLTFTIPVRDGATYSGDGVSPTLTIDGIVYTIHGTSDLTNNSMAIAELSEPLSTGMPSLSAGYSYRTFYLQNSSTMSDRAFIKVAVSVSQ